MEKTTPKRRPKFVDLVALILPEDRKDKFLGFVPLPVLEIARKIKSSDVEKWGRARMFEETIGVKPYGKILVTTHYNLDEALEPIEDEPEKDKVDADLDEVDNVIKS
jgi:hypothetical protein